MLLMRLQKPLTLSAPLSALLDGEIQVSSPLVTNAPMLIVVAFAPGDGQTHMGLCA